ncbi:hypothetical protein [Pseudomonas sp. BIGb0164]|uniref:hypothetical protein n=1 Tax=Pseudomonas sp. BIGb0164 TaxID=2940605 RepID=UPI0021694474|nr:hypothetical protein [Pseudomonas sp. BIGb0164]MCS4251445.1 hypothetical protein [Pseudomonas sp. BIGb0164]
MSYFDEELSEDLNNNDIPFNILSESEQISITRRINKIVPFSVNKVAWSRLSNSIDFGQTSSDSAILQLAEEIKMIADGDLIFIGDSACDEAYFIPPEYIKKAIKIFSELPQHTYIVQDSLAWIACVSFEGDLNFANLS